MATEMSFQEWLERRAQEVNQPERLRRRSEWIAALDQFREQVTSWIRESDPKGLLIIERMEIERTEPRLGTYTAPALKISLGDAAVRVVPMGRDVRGSYRSEDGTECLCRRNPSGWCHGLRPSRGRVAELAKSGVASDLRVTIA